MSVYTHSHTHGLSRVFENTAHWMHQLATRINEQRAFRQTYRELSELSDRELSDIGLGRGDIYDVARKSANTYR